MPAVARFCAILLLAAIAGCGSRADRILLARTMAPATASQIAGEEEIFVATTRHTARNPREIFSGRRGEALSFARVEMTVPAIHRTGEIERPVNPDVADPARYLTARQVALYRDAVTFRAALSRSIHARNGRVLLFVHGYNTSFDGAVYRMTQIVHDAGYEGTAVLFSWPSAGQAFDYVYDNNSATASRDALERTLRLIADAGASRIDIVAHSMGGWATMEALRQLAITGHRDLGGRLGDVVLASPDIDVDVFKSQMRRYGKPDDNFIILTSGNDRALTVSGFIAGRQPRVGDYRDAQDLAAYGIIVVDVTSISSRDRLNHTKFAKNPLLIKLLGEGLADEGDFGTSEDAITKRINALTEGLGKTITSAADIIITTPVEVLNIAVGGK